MPRPYHAIFWLFVLFCTAATANAQDIPARERLLVALCGDAAAMQSAAISLTNLAATASPADVAWGHQIIQAVMNRKLVCSGAAAQLDTPGGALDAATLASTTAATDSRTPVLSLKNRSQFESLAASFSLLVDPSVEARGAALKLFERKPELLPAVILERMANTEKDPVLRDRLTGLAQAGDLKSGDPVRRLEAIRKLAATPSTRTLTLLAGLKSETAYQADPAFREAVEAAISRVEQWMGISTLLATIYNGLSLASILFMAAVGLAVIFGLMGVINLAQGEFIMMGAYITFLVQEGFKALLPGLLDWYLIAAVPVVFAGTSLIGIAFEMLLIRRFYTRPLMSLLATWAVSLFLINSVRLIFGTQNLQFVTPFYVAGGMQVFGDFIITWNRLFAIAFALLTLTGTWFVLQRTSLGLNIRAVTLNRTMAGCIGIPTRQVDRLAFGLGSGLAGLAGLALCQIYNVNPQMGTLFIIDSFMVVVLGGVGTLLGTFVASIGVGQINILIEPLYGAVAAKVIVLLMIIGFLQWRPEGLFAIKGRRK